LIPLSSAKRIIIKLGTGILRTDEGLINNRCIESICREINALRENGTDVIIVSSGAIGLGMSRLKMDKRPTELEQLQACAAIGQSQLINIWQKHLDVYKITVGQILLTRDDLNSEKRYAAVINTIEQILKSGAIPIVNENDTVSAEEIKFGDNDTLSALVAKATKADLLMILSNIAGLMDTQNENQVIHQVDAITQEIEALASDTQKETSVGGMISKLSAAKIALEASCGVFIGSGDDTELFQKILRNQSVGTYFTPSVAQE
jgi:glutamate 5-kinase